MLLRRYLKNTVLLINIAFAFALAFAYLANHVSPAKYWFVAFFGLAYPFSLLINIGFIVFWAWRKKTWFIISLVVILLGFSNISRFVQISSSDKKQNQSNEVKLISYNVRTFNHYRQENEGSLRDSILHFLRSEEPDIICFQEYLIQEDMEEMKEKFIIEQLERFPYQILGRIPRKKYYGNTIFSVYPIVKKGKLKFSGTHNACIFADIKVNDDTIRIYNVHLQSISFQKNDYYFVDSITVGFDSAWIEKAKNISRRLKQAYIKRAKQVDMLKTHISDSPHPVIVCGDFNDTPVSYTYNEVKGNLRDAFISAGQGIGNTYRGKFPSFRIDFIFHDRALTSKKYKTHDIRFSDHYPVSFTFFGIIDKKGR